ncbi:MAG: AAC(3) family N-acetyltransferase [Flavobacteriales bacterium]|nr:AAC(3) family N-acetyltransferase [Flavobacteriales bacterium]
MNEWDDWLSNWIKQIPLKEASRPLVISSDFSGMALKAAKMKQKVDPITLIRVIENELPGITLLIPAYKNHYQAGEYFDPLNTLPDTGVLARKALKSKEFLRTADPLHSFLIKGPLVESCLRACDDSTFGANSVFGWLYKYHAFQLLIDVDLQHSFTFAHYVEEQLRVNYRKYQNLIIPIKQSDGTIFLKKVRFYAKKPGYNICLNGLQPKLVHGNALRHGVQDGIAWMLIDLHKAYEIIVNDIQHEQAQNLITFDIRQYIRDVLKMLLIKA